jgi:twitching motility protein PilT
MAAIDGLLNIVVNQEATELRLTAHRPPRLFRGGEERPLTMPATSPEVLESLLGALLAPHESVMRERGSASFAYRSESGVDFDVIVDRLPVAEGSGLDAHFTRRAAGGGASDGTASEVRAAAELSPVIGTVLARAAALGASDVHLAQGRPPIVRVDGELRTLHGVESPDVSALLQDRAQLERVHAGRSVDLGLDVPDVGRLRVNVYAAGDGLSAAIRILSRDAPKLSDLHLPPVVQSLVSLPHGLVIACGPTGSGKSTTLAALARQALTLRARVLITLEDPIEYRIPAGREGGLVRQREIGREVTDFATGLRDALREDPDILLIGEMRDAETIGLALTAAETGHLVLTSLHSRTSASAIERIVDIYPPERQRQIRVQLADSLRAVLAQRLLPRADGSGRVPAVEFLRVNFGVANLIREGKTQQIPSAVQSGGDEGMVPLERSLAELVRAELVPLDAARGVATDPTALDDYLRAQASRRDP